MTLPVITTDDLERALKDALDVESYPMTWQERRDNLRDTRRCISVLGCVTTTQALESAVRAILAAETSESSYQERTR